MSTTDKQYFLFDPKTETAHHELGHLQLVQVLKDTYPQTAQDWYGWCLGMEDWLPIGEIPEMKLILDHLALELAKDAKRPPPFKLKPVPAKLKLTAAPVAASAPITAKLTTEEREAVYVQKRRFERHRLKFKVMIVCEGSVFRTECRNISLGGMELNHSIPAEFTEKLCVVHIVHSMSQSQHQLKFRVKLVQNGHEGRRLSFVEPGAALVEELKNWIAVAQARVAA